MKRLPLKAILSTALLLMLLFLAISGAVLYFNKTGLALGIPRASLRQAHFIVAAAMCAVVIVHLFLNFKQYKAELRALGRFYGADNPEKSEQGDEKRQ